MRDHFSTFDVNKALNVPRERLRDWMVRGYIEPSIKADGAGTRAVFDRVDIYLIALFKSLIEGGLARENASAFVKLLRNEKSLEQRLSDFDFIIFKTYDDLPNEAAGYTGEIDYQFIEEDKDGPRKWNRATVHNYKKIRQEVDNKLNSL